MNEHIQAEPTIWYKNQRLYRTLFQAVIGAVPVVVALLAILNDAFPAEWLAYALGLSVAVQGVLAKIMANDVINAWLTAHTFLGSEPKK